MPAPLSQKVCDRIELLCRVHTYRDVAAIVRVHERTVGSIARNGFKAKGSKPRKQRPSDYAIQSAHMNVRQLVKHYEVSTTTLARWNREIGRPMNRSNPRPSIPIPAKRDIDAAVAEMGVGRAAKHFGVCRALLHRWRRKLGSPMRKHRDRVRVRDINWAERYVAERRHA